MRRTSKYGAMTNDEPQRSRWTLYNAVNFLWLNLLFTALLPKHRHRLSGAKRSPQEDNVAIQALKHQ